MRVVLSFLLILHVLLPPGGFLVFTFFERVFGVVIYNRVILLDFTDLQLFSISFVFMSVNPLKAPSNPSISALSPLLNWKKYIMGQLFVPRS